MTQPLTILRIDASARNDGSVSRQLADVYIDRLAETRAVRVDTRDVSVGLPVINQDWIAATFTPEVDRSPEHRATLTQSDRLVEELERNELIVISTPIYNFGIPASLKLWVDQIARAGRTFRYTDTGPVGLLSGKRAVILVASGGTEVGSEIDFATPYLLHVLGFLGITDVDVIAADQLGRSGPEKIEQVKSELRARAD